MDSELAPLEASPLAGFEVEIDSLRETGALFFQRGWSVGTSSNYSIILDRDPLRLLVTASGKDKGRLERGDFVLVDGTGQPSEPGQPKSSAETMLHVVLAQHGAGAVLHTHSVWATVLSDLFAADGGLIIEGYEMLKGLEGITTHEHASWVRIFENTQDIPMLAQQVAAELAVDENPLQHGFLLRRHGLYTWGDNLFQARRHIEIFEFLFECIAQRMQLAGCMPKR